MGLRRASKDEYRVNEDPFSSHLDQNRITIFKKDKTYNKESMNIRADLNLTFYHMNPFL